MILAPDAFKEHNMANISTTIKVDISVTLSVTENIPLGASCSPKEVVAYKAIFTHFRTFCGVGSYS